MLEIVEARGNPLPDWATDAPELLPGEEWFLKAFWDLCTERKRAASGLGSIPWSAVIRYGRRAGLDRDAQDTLWTVMRTMDYEYQTWYAEETKPVSKKREEETEEDERS